MLLALCITVLHTSCFHNSGKLIEIAGFPLSQQKYLSHVNMTIVSVDLVEKM